MLHASIVVRASRIAGRGLYAASAIEEGEIVWRDEPEEPRFSLHDIRTWSRAKQRRFHRYSYQVNDECYAGREDGVPHSLSYLMNHSCDPTTWFLDDRTGVARRRIEAGEEITYDYATSEIDGRWRMKCRCGSARCRGVVSGLDYLRVDLQRRYGPHMMRHVLRAARDAARRRHVRPFRCG